MAAFESLFSTVVLVDLAVSATEDAVDARAMDVPGMTLPLRTRQSLPTRIGNLLIRLAELGVEFPLKRVPIDRLINFLKQWNTQSDLTAAIALWHEYVSALDEFEELGFTPTTTGQVGGALPSPCFTLSTETIGNRLALRASTQFHIELSSSNSFGLESDFVRAVTAMCAKYRACHQRRFSSVDRLALLRAYHLVEFGVVPAPQIQPLRTDRLRPCSTYLALADPGRAHLQTTVWDDRMLDGLVVHVETIDRAGITDRRQVEAYRIPSIRDVARIRVHVGAATPCSVYVGRPVFEGWRADPSDNGGRQDAFDQSLLKAAHTVAAACTGFFSLGVAECKIGLDGLTAQQAIETMRALSGNVIRDRFRQRLSAAFNINTPMVDDRDPNRTQNVTDRLKVAQLGIDLAVRGGFDKVTWDGAIDGPSQPLLEQVSASQLLELVHRAHERGLETYISAGMTEAHMIPATQVGVGGVGMGILMHAKSDNGMITQLLPDRVREVLAVRDNARQHVAGRAASVLAKLDWSFANGTLSDQSVEEKRQELYQALLTYHRLETPHERLLYEVELERYTLAAESSLTSMPEVDEPVRGSDAKTAINADPVFEVARGKLQQELANDPEKVSKEAKQLKFLITSEDAEALRALLGYD